MSPTYDRRSFLTHSAATIGGVAMAGTVVDSLVAGVAGATTGVNTGTPKRGGTLTVGLISDVPNYHAFSGQKAGMDASGFCVANALYDPLFVMSANGKVALPMLALSAIPNADYTVWTIHLRHNVKFTNGKPFNADIVLQNYAAAKADPAVGLAIRPIIANVTKVDNYTVTYTLVIPYSTLPILLADQQIAYMAYPATFSPTFTGMPVGTGPFKMKSWAVGVESQFVRNSGYWKYDAHHRKLPYLNGINFKTIADDNARNQALQTGAVDMILSQNGSAISNLKGIKNITYRTDVKDPRDPSVNFLIVNTTGTMNQYFAWAGIFTASAGIPGALQSIQKGEVPPTQVQMADWMGTLGAVDPGTLTWNVKLKPVLNDLTIRKACAMAINRQTYWKVVGGSSGVVANGIYKPTSRFYDNPGYPAYNPSGAKALVNAYKAANNVSTVGFVLDIVAGNSDAQKGFGFLQQQLSAIGITVTPRPLVQSALIANVIYGMYDCATWNQFGGVDPALNYIWVNSFSATSSLATGGLGMPALPAGTRIAGAVNYAHMGDVVVETSMLKAMAQRPNSAAQKALWQRVNKQLAKDIPYLWLDTLVTAFAARKNIQNWVSGTAGDGTTRCLSPDGGSARWDQIWKS
jgi:ABC-type transport system substrate-binding protein